jgi:hypothetical protein
MEVGYPEVIQPPAQLMTNRQVAFPDIRHWFALVVVIRSRSAGIPDNYRHMVPAPSGCPETICQA